MNLKILILLSAALIAVSSLTGLTIWANKPRGIRTDF